MIPAPYSQQLIKKDLVGVFPEDKSHAEVKQIMNQPINILTCKEFKQTPEGEYFLI